MVATIKDVAKEAKVSIATVSHVLNHTRYVSPELVERVNSAIEKLNYYPNMLVGGLRSKQTYSIGLVLPSISNETFGKLAETIQKLLLIENYNLIVCNTSNDYDLEISALNTLIMKSVDAIIIIPSTHNAEKIVEVQNRGIPVILVDRDIEDLDASRVKVDYKKATYNAVNYLIDNGHTEIGYIDRAKELSHSMEQRDGYLSALKDANIEINPKNYIRCEGYDYLDGVNAIQQLIKKNPMLSAVLAYYDVIALGAIRGAVDAGYSVPDDLSVIGCDNMPFTSALVPRLTTINFPIEEISKAVIDLVMMALNNSKEKKNIIVDGKLIVRDSVTKPRVSNRGL
ncbi:MAG: LacI family DNA-binding transcriptional regulator [Sphaerochaetaceae bacterium]